MAILFDVLSTERSKKSSMFVGRAHCFCCQNIERHLISFSLIWLLHCLIQRKMSWITSICQWHGKHLLFLLLLPLLVLVFISVNNFRLQFNFMRYLFVSLEICPSAFHVFSMVIFVRHFTPSFFLSSFCAMILQVEANIFLLLLLWI